MVSRRNFITITLIMLVLLFLFQVPEVIRERMYDYGSNAYAKTQETTFDRQSVVSVTKKDVKQSGRYIVFIGDLDDHATGSAVRQWCAYSKRYVESYSSISDYTYEINQIPEAIVLDSDCLHIEKDMEILEKLTKKGIHLIFCGLPDVDQLKRNAQLKTLMGIRAVLSDGIRVKGIHLFDGLLLGGEQIYKLENSDEKFKQDLEIVIPWCQPASGTKTYMAGMMDKPVKNEEFPAVIWRNSIGQSRIFVVNGDYINGNAGIGFLEGMLYETNSYAIYPIINAQNLVVLNYPMLASENEEEMMRLYSCKPQALFRDLVWPGLAVVMEKSKKKMTCMLAPQQDYTDQMEPDPDHLVHDMKLLQERQGEAGISGTVRKVNAYETKLKKDKIFLDQKMPDYEFLSFYQDVLTKKETEQALHSDLLSGVRTVLTDYDKSETLVDYLNADIIRQRTTDDGWSEQTFSENLRIHSIETALGYSNIAVDMNRMIYPQSDEDTWEKLYDRFAGNVTTYWKAYEGFEATTLAESDLRIRRFLALNYTQERKDQTIQLKLENFDKEAYFLLRLHGETVKNMQGAGYEKIQKGVWLVQAQQEQVTITLGEEGKRTFHDE